MMLCGQLRGRLLAVLALAGFLIVPGSGPAKAEEFVTIGTGGVTGVYYPVGGAICRKVNKGRKEHGVRCTVESTSASVYNVTAIRSGALNLGIVQSDTQYYAYTGTGSEQFAKAGPDKDLRALFSLQSEAFTLVTRDGAGIKGFKDLAGKRVNLGDPGSGNRDTFELLMMEFNWTPATFKPATYVKPAEMAGALCDNKIDAYIYIVGHPNGSIKEAAACKARLVPVTGPHVDAFMKKYPFYPPTRIPGGMYRGTDTDVNTFGPRATLLANVNLPEEAAYQITRAVFENLEEFKKLHPALADLTPRNMREGNSVPYHPGAVRYFIEAKLMK